MASYQQLQSRNVMKSIGMTLAVAGITLVGGYLIGLYFDNPIVGLAIAAVVAGFQALIAWFSGADIVLAIHRAHEIDASNVEYRQYYNIVEEVRIAAGIPMPRAYVINDPSPNAFATGKNPKDGRIAVTTGLLTLLNREELQGVVAHEMAHIKNRDILLQTIVGIMVGIVLIVSDMMFYGMLFGGGRGGDNDRGGHPIMLILGLAFMILAPIIAQMMQFAISREREYLADATGAEFTRNPDGLASALNKICLQWRPIRSGNRGTEHMFIVSPLKQPVMGVKAASLMSTHPPAEDRIERLHSIGRGFSAQQAQ